MSCAGPHATIASDSLQPHGAASRGSTGFSRLIDTHVQWMHRFSQPVRRSGGDHEAWQLGVDGCCDALLAFAFVCLGAEPAHAQNMNQCITRHHEGQFATLINTCAERIDVAWCVDARPDQMTRNCATPPWDQMVMFPAGQTGSVGPQFPSVFDARFLACRYGEKVFEQSEATRGTGYFRCGGSAETSSPPATPPSAVPPPMTWNEFVAPFVEAARQAQENGIAGRWASADWTCADAIQYDYFHTISFNPSGDAINIDDLNAHIVLSTHGGTSVIGNIGEDGPNHWTTHPAFSIVLSNDRLTIRDLNGTAWGAVTSDMHRC